MSETGWIAPTTTRLLAAMLSLGLAACQPPASTPSGGETTSSPSESSASSSTASEPPAGETASDRGYRYLLTRAYGAPSEVNAAVIANLWTIWPEPLRSQAAAATPEVRRAMTFSRYGLLEVPPGAPAGRPEGVPLNYTVDENGKWQTNCFLCHAGKVAGTVIPGINNTGYGLQTYLEELVKFFTAQGATIPPNPYPPLIPSLTRGTSNAFGQAETFLAFRDNDLQLFPPDQPQRPLPTEARLDTEAPPWFNSKKKKMLYWDGFIEKTPRDLMQFVLTPNNPGERVKGWDADFQDILAWIEALEPPRYPFEIDQGLAQRGLLVFVNHCTECHGTYGAGASYPENTVPLAELGTDPVRVEGMQKVFREFLRDSWLGADGTGANGRSITVVEPTGYVAPPLDGIWASAPYFHNGSVPTLWEILFPDQRPKVWLRHDVGEVSGYDQEKVGLKASRFDALPGDVTEGWQVREYFQTGLRGKSAAGHSYPEIPLSEDDAKALLEYLKTL